ncbi:hypothetical protein KI688_009556 [Linnemannia hyalina]|uniref:phosphatidate phosphatase n=1 Tax=Linnemannia hyalina TaxID=64524 RepID=A0A9P7Y124_9FUNG|nr:hypothetical protein KI688_009556 [Linnemannia hyalina]
MQSVGSFFSTVSKFYNEINPATLSGAIDVVVVEQANGDLACSPFHVRFGKLSILRPQEKVVEVTINGRVVDFPMKVGDAGEAFFVFETEQEVPEEFATSPLAGPSSPDKVEDEIDFLDLTQGEGGGHVTTQPNDQGYVSAHSGHGSEFEEDEQEFPPPSPAKRHPYASAAELGSNSYGTGQHQMRIEGQASPHDIMENFQPVHSAGPFGDHANTHDHFGYQPSIPVVSSDGTNSRSQFLSPPHKDDVIMDITGYKTDDSAETDLESDDPSAGADASKSSPRTRRRRKRVARRNMGFSPSGATTRVGHEPTEEAKETDSRLPSRPIQSMFHRKAPYRVKRSCSLPNVLEPQGLLLQLEESVQCLNRPTRTHQAIAAQQPRRLHLHWAANMNTTHIVTIAIIIIIAMTRYQTPRTAKATQDSEWSWGWGSLPVKNDSMEGIVDADQKGQHSTHVSIDIPATPKPVLNEIEIEGETYRVAISLCPGDEFGKDVIASEALFATHQVTFEEFGKDPLKILNNKSLVCLINDRYFTWAAAGPYLASLVLFRKPLSDETLHQLSVKDSRHLSDRSQTQEQPTRFGALSRWLRGSPTANQLSAIEQGLPRHPSGSDEAVPLQQPDEDGDEEKQEAKPTSGTELHLDADKEPMIRSTSMPIQRSKSVGSENSTADQATTLEPKHQATKRYAKTLRLTSDQLKSLNLKKGANTLTFAVTSSYQGKAICSAKLFLWDHDYQVVISDIDGTITKSDALGHIFTMAGKDWTHPGVAKLYTDIANNGYHILYLTSRAIGQADYTRKYLKNVEQDNYYLPDGPVIMSPDRLMTAFHREVIMRKPEEFKMACLRDIRRLFEDRNPFYAGFGNRITDAMSYRSVNVPSSRIFTIDSGGEVKLELLSSYKSSYLALNDLVNEIFPGMRQAPEFNDWNFWKPPMPTIDLPMAPSPQPTLPSNPTNPGSFNSGGVPGRLGVIRSFTNSLTSSASGSLKKRSSIPTFSSSPVPVTSPPASSPPLPPSSAPAGLQIVDRTRRLSLSLMKYGGSHSASASATNVTASSSMTQATNGQISSSPPSSHSETLAPHQNARSRGMSMTTLSSLVYVPSNLGTSPPTTSSTLSSEVHPLDIPTVRKASSFSVSPPQLASRLTETVIPFLRGRSSRSEQGQKQQQQDVDAEIHQHHEETLPSSDEYSEGTIVEQQYEDEYESYSGDRYDAGEEAGEYEEYEYDDGEELDGDLEDDVELNIDAPFL